MTAFNFRNSVEKREHIQDKVNETYDNLLD